MKRILLAKLMSKREETSRLKKEIRSLIFRKHTLKRSRKGSKNTSKKETSLLLWPKEWFSKKRIGWVDPEFDKKNQDWLNYLTLKKTVKSFFCFLQLSYIKPPQKRLNFDEIRTGIGEDEQKSNDKKKKKRKYNEISSPQDSESFHQKWKIHISIKQFIHVKYWSFIILLNVYSKNQKIKIHI